MTTGRITASLFLPDSIQSSSDGKGQKVIDLVDVFLGPDENSMQTPPPARPPSPLIPTPSQTPLPLHLYDEHFAPPPYPQATALFHPKNADQAIHRAALGERLLMQVKCVNQKSRIRKTDQAFDRDAKAFKVLRSNRFNIYGELYALKKDFMLELLDTGLIIQLEKICRRIQANILSSDPEKTEPFTEIAKAMNDLTQKTEAFCRQLDEEYIQFGYDPNNPNEVKCAEINSAIYDVYLCYYLEILQAIKFGRYDELTSQTFDFIETCQTILADAKRDDTVSISHEKVRQMVNENINNATKPQQNMAYNYFNATAGFINKSDWAGLGDYVLNVLPSMAAVRAGGWDSKDEKDGKEAKQAPLQSNGNEHVSSMGLGMMRKRG